jgi:hypothetical protein
MICCVKGFSSKVQGLKFEFAWQHPFTSVLLKVKNILIYARFLHDGFRFIHVELGIFVEKEKSEYASAKTGSEKYFVEVSSASAL